MPAKIYLRILQGGIIASFLIVFLVFRDLLFPFITSKQLTFNILMEFLFAVWLIFILRYPQYRPKTSYITFGLLAYFTAILASCAVSVDFGLSFWGDAERMLGLFHLLHFLIFYLVLITVFRSWREWRILLMSSVLVATVVSLVGLAAQSAFIAWLVSPIIYLTGLGSLDTYSTIGNTAYVSGYLIFNIFFILILFFRSERKSWRWLYALPLAPMIPEFWSCHTSGAIIGLFLSLLLLFFLLGLFHKNRSLRRGALAIFIIAVIGIIFVFSQYQAAWFQNSFLRNFTSQKATFQTRLISWRGAVADFPNHWLFGTGFGNYAIIFDKYFDSTFFNYTKTDTYFDRAHNNLIDIASTTGTVGLLTYLSIFAAALYYLGREFKRNGGKVGTGDAAGQKNLEIIIIISLLSAYFIQNLAVFDSYITYVGLMIMLGFIYWLIVGSAERSENEELEAVEAPRPRLSAAISRYEIVILIVFLVVTYIFTNQYNLRPWRMFQGVIAGYGNFMEGNFVVGLKTYQTALVGTPLDHDGAVTLINLITANPAVLNYFTPEEASAVLDYTISLAEANVAGNPRDSLMEMQLAQILDTAARVNYSNYTDLAKFNSYSSRALLAMDQSIAASPGRAPLYLVKGQMLLFRGDNEEAIKAAQYAISLNTSYPESYCRLAQFYLFLESDSNISVAKKAEYEKGIGENLTQCVDLGGANDINSSLLLTKALTYFSGRKDYARTLKLAQRLVAIDPTNATTSLNLAKLYLISGDQENAQVAADKAISLDAKLKTDWASFLGELKKVSK